MTIDWVALTAGILLLGIMVVYAIFNNGVSSLVSNVNLDLRQAASEGLLTSGFPALGAEGLLYRRRRRQPLRL